MNAPITLAAGVQNLRFVVESGDSNFNYFYISNSLSTLNQNTTSEDDSLKIYPIPSKDVVNVYYTSDKEQYSNYEIIDIRGKSVLRSSFQTKSDDNIQKIDVSRLTEGRYVLKVKVGTNVLFGKIIKIK